MPPRADSARQGGASAVDHFGGFRGMVELWFGLLAGPAAWFLHLNVSYSLVRLVCETGDMWLLHLVTLLTVLPAALGVWIAHRSWRRLDEPRETTGEGTLGRSRFMALGGIGLSGFFLLVLLLAWLPDFFLHPCAI